MERIEVGKVINTHGLKGEIKVLPYSDEPERFRNFKEIIIRQNSTDVSFQVVSVKIIKNTAVLGLAGLSDIDYADKLKGSLVLIDIDELPSLPEDAFFVKDLVGCKVIDDGKGMLGTLIDVFFTGSNDVYDVAREGKKNLLIPALKSVVQKVDLNEKTVLVKLPNGLYEIYDE